MTTSTATHPKHHARLTDGTTNIDIVFTDGEGTENIRAFKVIPYPRTALKTAQGDSKYSDLEPPYLAIAQDDWTGGRGNEDFEADTTRYFDGHWLDTTSESGVVLGGRETYTTGYRNMDQALPGSVTFQGAYVATRYLAVSFLGSGSYTSYQCEIWVKKVGSPGDLIVSLYDDDSNPKDSKATKTITAANITTDTISLFKDFVWTGTPSITATTFWVVIDGGAAATATDHWAIGVDAATAGVKKATAGSWSATTYSPYYRITPDSDGFAAGSTLNFSGLMFEYKRGLYMITQPYTGGNSSLYINGDRGAADANTGALTTLIDGTRIDGAAWTTNEWAGDVVLLTKGTGSEETQNWRTISSNTGTTLTVSPAWNVTHDTTTEYVILGSDKWTSQASLGVPVTDVEVGGEFIWMAAGGDNGDNGIVRYRYYNNSSGVWTAEAEATSNAQISDKLLAVNHSDDGEMLYSTTTGHAINDISLYKAKIPRHAISADEWLFYPEYEFDTSVPWNSKAVTYVTPTLDAAGYTKFTIASNFVTGVAGVLNLDPPLDLRQGKQLVAEVKTAVSGGISTGQYTFVYDDVADMALTESPDKVLKADYAYDLQPSIIYHWDDPDGTEVFTDMSRMYDGVGIDGDTITLTSDDYLAIGASEKFSQILVNIGTVPNAVATSVMTGYYSKPEGFANATILDGTIDSEVTLAKDGNITFTIPEDWKKTTINSVEAYWIALTPDKDLTASVDIREIYLSTSAAEAATTVPSYDDLTNIYDGDANTYERMKLAVEDYIYVGHGTKFNIITVDVGTANDISSVMTGAYFNGSVWTSVTIIDNTKSNSDTLKTDGTITFTIPNDWEANTVDGTEAYWIRLDVATALTAMFSINEITVTRQNNLTVDIPTIGEGVWTTVMMDLPIPGNIPDTSAIASIGLNIATDKGADVFHVKKLWLANTAVDSIPETAQKMPKQTRINGLEAYAGSADDPVLNPWILTEDMVYEMQTQNDDVIVPLPLGEIGTLRSSENGLGHCVNGTYLFFNMGEKIERYFNRTLDDVGPDRDEGLPSGRSGIPKSMASYPGRIFSVIDAGTAGTSSVLTLKGTSWHEVYRAPQTGLRISNIYVQAIPGTNVDRLWISMGSDILWVPISLSPYNETDFTYTHEGHLITSYIYAGMQDVVKLWKSLKVFAEDVGTNYYIVADYQTDTSTTWTEIGTFDTTPVEEIDIASTLPTGRRIRFRLRFISNDVSESPRMKAIVTEGVAFVPVKNQYAMTFAIATKIDQIDLAGVHDDALTPLARYDKLKDWANDGQVLTFTTVVPMADSKTVFIDPLSLSPLRVVPQKRSEKYVCQLTAIEV